MKTQTNKPNMKKAEREERLAKNRAALATYYVGSASASIIEDYKQGRVVVKHV